MASPDRKLGIWFTGRIEWHRLFFGFPAKPDLLVYSVPFGVDKAPAEIQRWCEGPMMLE
jgi:hypothetical protein